MKDALNVGVLSARERHSFSAFDFFLPQQQDYFFPPEQLERAVEPYWEVLTPSATSSNNYNYYEYYKDYYNNGLLPRADYNDGGSVCPALSEDEKTYNDALELDQEIWRLRNRIIREKIPAATDSIG